MNSEWKALILMAGIFLFGFGLVQAMPVTIQISGTINNVDDIGNILPDTIHAGGFFTGTYTYDSSTPDSDSSSYHGSYQHDTSSGIYISLGGYEFKTDTNNGLFMGIDDNFIDPYGLFDEYLIFSGENSPLLFSDFYLISWRLYDDTHQAVSSDVLPVEAPVLSNWNTNEFVIASRDSKTSELSAFHIGGIVTQVEVIPEPATLVLLGLGGLLIRKKIRINLMVA